MPDVPSKGMSGFLRIMEGFSWILRVILQSNVGRNVRFLNKPRFLLAAHKKSGCAVPAGASALVMLSAIARMDLVDAAGAGVSRTWLPSSVTAGGQDKIDSDSMELNLAIAVRFVHARSARHGQCRSGWRQGCGAGAASSVPPASRVKSISPRSMPARSTRTRTRSPSRSTWREPVATSWLRLRSHS